MKPHIVDIETGPADAIDQFAPEIEAPSNYKDPAKIEAYKAEKLREWKDSAALSAITGKVLAIGLRYQGEFIPLIGDEATVIKEFWQRVTRNGAFIADLIGFNNASFDIPFLVRRSWKLGVDVPSTLVNGRYLNSRIIDLMQVWKCGDYQASVSLDKLARYLGVGEKSGSGAEFAALLATDKPKAIEYLANDLLLTEKCALRLGVVDLEDVTPGDY